ncbi:tyrosine-type recombinase/integrase [Anaerosinus gibii]|uniref:tyrosine-type recombinase/integrase n=1 Tax=Selenobaculum gibii TaxID=3054208 RepID=UPI0011C89480
MNLAKKLKSKNIHPHSFLYTHTSLLAEAGVPLEVIQDRLGYSDDSLTKEICLHIAKKLQNDAAKKFANLMNGSK